MFEKLRVYFRAFEIEDYKIFHKFRNDEKSYKVIMGNKFFVSTEREKKWVEDKIFNDRENIYLAACLIENDDLIGYTSVNNIDLRNRNAKWGSIFIREEYRKKRLSIDIGTLLLKLVFEEMPIYRFYSQVLESHIGSLEMVSKLGFKQEGIARCSIYKSNKFHNVINISMLKNEYDKIYHRTEK